MNSSRINNHLQLEDLPNELFHQIQSYLTSTDFASAFSNLNYRFEVLLMSSNNLHFEIRSSVLNQRSSTVSFASGITHLIVPNDSDAVAIADVFPNVRTIVFHRSIRVLPKTMPLVERIKLDLSNMRPKEGISVCRIVFSGALSCLSSFSIFHGKKSVRGHWNSLINSIRLKCQTLTEFLFDIQPTIEWKLIEHFLRHLPNLKRLIIRKMNTRSRWTLKIIAQTLQTYTSHLNYLFIRITFLGSCTLTHQDDNYDQLHPLFLNVSSKQGKSFRKYSRTIIRSN